MKIRTRVLLPIALTTTLLPVAASAQAATGSQIQFRLIYYNSPGSDNGSNASLNAEYVTLKNTGTTSRKLAGWTVEDLDSHVYTFPSFTLKAGSKVRIHTGSGTNTATDLYWGRKAYVWNNNGDKAKLHNAAGTWEDACAWGSSGPGYLYC